MSDKLHVFNERAEPVASVEHLLKLLKEKDEEIERLKRRLASQALRQRFIDPELNRPTQH